MLELPPQHVDRLVEDLQTLCTEPPLSQLSKFDLGKWSLYEIQAPIYPESRFQVPAARALIELYPQVDWQLT